jgi:hypothetical protein
VSKQRGRDVRLETQSDGEQILVLVPTVDMPPEPKVRIYDPANDGSYWFSKIGFHRRINDDA